MTREEAEQIIKELWRYEHTDKYTDEEIREALDMGLNALRTLEKLRSELHATAEMHEDGDYYLRDEWIDEYFDAYKAEC